MYPDWRYAGRTSESQVPRKFASCGRRLFDKSPRGAAWSNVQAQFELPVIRFLLISLVGTLRSHAQRRPVSISDINADESVSGSE